MISGAITTIAIAAGAAAAGASQRNGVPIPVKTPAQIAEEKREEWWATFWLEFWFMAEMLFFTAPFAALLYLVLKITFAVHGLKF